MRVRPVAESDLPALLEVNADESVNHRSARLLQRLGFTRKGLLRQRGVSKGENRDVEMHGLLRDEWPAPDSPRGA